MAKRRARSGRELIARTLRNFLAIAVLGVGVAYLADDAVLRYRVATHHQAFQTITVRPVDAVPQKNHRTEFLIEDPQDETCVNSLFPHLGDPPCWYLSRHREPQISM